jgi:hypothetical protein
MNNERATKLAEQIDNYESVLNAKTISPCDRVAIRNNIKLLRAAWLREVMGSLSLLKIPLAMLIRSAKL